MSDCPLCMGIQSIPETSLVRTAVEKKEMAIETLLIGMRDSMVLGWALRDGEAPLCDEHAKQVEELTSESDGET